MKVMLTNREHEILELVCMGKTNQEISERLIVSKSTVKKHIQHILIRFNVKNTKYLILAQVKEKNE